MGLHETQRAAILNDKNYGHPYLEEFQREFSRESNSRLKRMLREQG